MKYLLCILVALALTIGILDAKEMLVLHKPDYTWVPCNCPGTMTPEWPPVLGLNQDDFIKHQMYMTGLEDIRNQCMGIQYAEDNEGVDG